MEVEILVQEGNTIELVFKGGDHSLAQLLAEKLNTDKNVEFSASKVDHPLIGSPHLIVRTKKGDPKDLILKKLDEIKKEVATFKDQFVDISK